MIKRDLQFKVAFSDNAQRHKAVLGELPGILYAIILGSARRLSLGKEKPLEAVNEITCLALRLEFIGTDPIDILAELEIINKTVFGYGILRRGAVFDLAVGINLHKSQKHVLNDRIRY